MNNIHFFRDQRKPAFRFYGLLVLIFAFTVISTPAYGHDKQSTEASSTQTDTGEISHISEIPSDVEEKPWITPDSTLYKVVKYTGKYHIMVLHFPIAFLIGAALMQWIRVVRGKGDSIVTVMLWFGTLGAVAAAALGWMYAYDSVYFGEEDINLLFWHRWLGTSTAVFALVVLFLRGKLGPKSLAVALSVCVALVAAAAHYGASLVYGPDFLFKF